MKQFCQDEQFWDINCGYAPTPVPQCMGTEADVALQQTPRLDHYLKCLLARPCNQPEFDACREQIGKIDPEQVQICLSFRSLCEDTVGATWPEEYCNYPFNLLITPAVQQATTDCLNLKCGEIPSCLQALQDTLDACNGGAAGISGAAGAAGAAGDGGSAGAAGESGSAGAAGEGGSAGAAGSVAIPLKTWAEYCEEHQSACGGSCLEVGKCGIGVLYDAKTVSDFFICLLALDCGDDKEKCLYEVGFPDIYKNQKAISVCLEKKFECEDGPYKWLEDVCYERYNLLYTAELRQKLDNCVSQVNCADIKGCLDQIEIDLESLGCSEN